MKRVEELIKEAVALIIQRDVKDPRLDFVTVSAVKVSKDLRNAIVYVTTHNESTEHIAEVLDGLKAASGFIRRELGERVTLRYLPALTFIYDTSLKEAFKIDAILHRIEAEHIAQPTPQIKNPIRRGGKN